ncbi:dihydrofolate reductase family protein [Dietzia cercidiphylli]|uniref:dihydrofolate reductase family protein n=1 Tax=Dietzia cercidiphylli TaxID=498199 RepID=UPI00223B2188|nr:dihydrofolate reductase family protein [Dietzia cercidiphylli]MCT1513905.1 dihydrofolate reductase family protein [Dietzia cercidiphylli]
MLSTRPPALDADPASLDAIWTALQPDQPTGAPMIRAVMISSIDGTTTVDGRSGGLGTPTDRLVYDAMRARADLVLVGSGTALAERYGPAVVSPVWTDRRTGPAPTVLVLTRSLPDRLIDLCAGTDDRVRIAAAHEVGRQRIEAARARGVRVHVLDPGPTGAAVRALASRLHAREVDFEGGPRLLGTLLSEGAVDDLVLSVAPELIVGGDDSTLTPGHGPGSTRVPMRVVSAFTCPRGGLYTRWAVGEGVR